MDNIYFFFFWVNFFEMNGRFIYIYGFVLVNIIFIYISGILYFLGFWFIFFNNYIFVF